MIQEKILKYRFLELLDLDTDLGASEERTETYLTIR